MSRIKLIVGLGNPGQQYRTTRHNAGFWFIDKLASRYQLNLQHKDKYYADIASSAIAGQSVYLLKPTTFMNLSGKSVQALANFYQIKAQEILAVHDELDIAPGRVRLKAGGGHGGHNGLRDMIKCLGSNQFMRLRVGIGHPGSANKVVCYVLSSPDNDDKISIDNALDNALETLDDIVKGNFESVMKQLHTKDN